METRMSEQGWRRTWTSVVLATLFGLGLVAASWMRPEPVAAERGLADVPRSGPAPGNHWGPPTRGPGHGQVPDGWGDRRPDDWRWRHRRPDDSWRWHHRHPGWWTSRPPGPVYCPGQWVWTGWGWAWAPGC